MKFHTKLFVSVRSYTGQSLPKARVTLLREDQTLVRLTYDPGSKLHYTEGQTPGHYQLRAESRGLLTETRPIFLAAGENHERFYLGPAGLPAYYRGFIRVPFDDRFDLVGVALAKHLTGAEELELVRFAADHGLAPEPVADMILRDRGRAFTIIDPQRYEDTRTNFADHELVRRTGPVIVLDHSTLSFMTNELIIKFEPHVTEEQSDTILRRHNLVKIQAIPYAQNTFLVQRPGPADPELLDVANGMLPIDPATPTEGEPVVYAEPDLVTTAINTQIIPQDYLYGTQWNLHLAGFEQAWNRLAAIRGTDKAFGDPDVLIAIMDDGIESETDYMESDPKHVDFLGDVSNSKRKITRFYNFADMKPGNTGTVYEHGVMVAGIATAMADNPVAVLCSTEHEGVASAAPNCRAIALMRPAGGSDKEYADAYIWTGGLDPGWGNAGPLPQTPGADVINSSFVRGPGELGTVLADAFTKLTSIGRGGKGVVLVFSVGNDGLDLGGNDAEDQEALGLPRAQMATDPRTIAATASTRNEAYEEIRTTYANHGLGLDVCAPSGLQTGRPTNGIPSSALDDPTHVQGHTGAAKKEYIPDFSGTSAAAPQVAGLVALMLSMNPDLTWVQVRDILRGTAVKTRPNGTPLPDGEWNLLLPGYSRYYGYGRINAGAAVERAEGLIEGSLETADVWIKENSNDVGDVPSHPMYSTDVWVRNRSPQLDPGPVEEHQSPIRGQHNWVHAVVRNRGQEASGPVNARLLVTRWPGTQYVYPDDFIPVVPPSSTPPPPEEMAPGSYLIGESSLAAIPPQGADRIVAQWHQNLVPPASVTINGISYSWADSCLLVDLTPHDGPPATGSLTADNNNICQRNLTIVDVSGQDELEGLGFVVGHETNLAQHLELSIHRKPLSPKVRLWLDYVDPATTQLVERALLRGSFAGYSITPVYRGRRKVFVLPAMTRVVAPIVRDPREYQPVALGASGLANLDPGKYRIEVAQRNPGGSIQGMLRFHLVKRSPA